MTKWGENKGNDRSEQKSEIEGFAVEHTLDEEKEMNGGNVMISTFEQVWDKIGGENKTYTEILETLQEEISQRSLIGSELYEARDFKELTKIEQERSAFIQVQYGIQDLTFLDNGNESDIWKAALEKRPEAQEREKERRSRWKSNTDAWSALIDDHRSEIEDAIWKARFLETATAREVEPQRKGKDHDLSDAIVQEVQQAGMTNNEAQTKEQEMSQIQGPNMMEVQAAEMKASIVQGLDKSADGSTHVEGQDIGYVEEGYMAAADQVKYEAQRARTADGETKAQEAEKREESISPKIGQRVEFQAHGTKTKLVGKVVDMDDDTVTLQSGRALIPALRDKGTFTEAPELKATHTKQYAKEQAQKHVGEQGSVFLAKGRGATYKGAIVELTPTFAIQKVNSETAILHRLKDLETKEKDGDGLIREGQEVSIAKEEPEKGGVTIESWNQEKEERQKVRELERSRGSQSR
jgi:hypothetical protein